MSPFIAVLWAMAVAIAVAVLLFYMGIVLKALYGFFDTASKGVPKSEDTQLLDWLEENGLAIEFQDKHGKFVRLRARREIEQARFKDIRDALRWAREQ